MDAPNQLNQTYQVIPSNQVKLTVLIGDGQKGMPVISIGNKIKAIGEVTQLLLGSGAELIGMELRIRTTVNDVNPKTNHTSITYVLEGGEEINLTINSGEVLDKGGSLFYNDSFTFK